MTLLAGCGKAPQPPQPRPESQWVANATDVIDELQRDLELSSSTGDTVAEARSALHDSGLYTILVAYTDFGGCRHMVRAVGAPPAGFAEVVRTLHAACTKFERAAALFTRATTRSDPHALLAATRLADGARPLLVRAREQLQAVGH